MTQPPSLPPNRAGANGKTDLYKVLALVLGALLLLLVGGIIAYFLFKGDNHAAGQQQDTKQQELLSNTLPSEQNEEVPVVVPSKKEEKVPVSSKSVTIEDENTDMDRWSSGQHLLHGEFNYNGSNYGFTIRFKYNARTGVISGATYEADGYGGKSKIEGMFDIDTFDMTFAGTNSGTRTEIYAEGNDLYGPYHGTMTRGTHSGTCVIRFIQ